MAEGRDKLKVAIACQGGGSHTAFAAGVLSVLLAKENGERFDLVALSGTSGGPCARRSPGRR
jgi:NTE family protein